MYIVYPIHTWHSWLLEILDGLWTPVQFFASLKRKALVASRAVTEIRQIYGRWPSMPVRMSKGWSMVESWPGISKAVQALLTQETQKDHYLYKTENKIKYMDIFQISNSTLSKLQ